MRSVDIADLKNHLSSYLNQVRRGDEILIRDRNVPVAKIVPLHLANEFGEELLALAAAGVVRLPEETLDLDAFWALPRPRISAKRAVKALIDDREERDAALLGR